jgi:hypothetical protein
VKQFFKIGCISALVLFVLIVIAAIIGSNVSDDQPTTTANTTSSITSSTTSFTFEPVITISANDLIYAYEVNEISADAQYKDKTIQVSGVISSINKDIFGKAYIELSAYIRCYFDNESALLNSSVGQNVTIQGTCDGKSVYIKIEDCSIIA